MYFNEGGTTLIVELCKWAGPPQPRPVTADLLPGDAAHVHTQHRWSSGVLRSGTCPTTYMAVVVEMPASDPTGHTPLLPCAGFVHVCEDYVSDSCVSASVTSAGNLSTPSAALVASRPG